MTTQEQAKSELDAAIECLKKLTARFVDEGYASLVTIQINSDEETGVTSVCATIA